jgi:hypothetical protein
MSTRACESIAFFRLTQAGNEREERFVAALGTSSNETRFDVARQDLLAIDGAPMAYWLPPEVLRVFGTTPALEPAWGEARVGLQTSDDPRFVR